MSVAQGALSGPDPITKIFNFAVKKPLLALAAGVLFCTITHALTTAAFVLPMGDIANAIFSWEFSSLEPVPELSEQMPDNCHPHLNGELHCTGPVDSAQSEIIEDDTLDMF